MKNKNEYNSKIKKGTFNYISEEEIMSILLYNYR